MTSLTDTLASGAAETRPASESTPLTGTTLTLSEQVTLPAQVCARHLRLLGAAARSSSAFSPEEIELAPHGLAITIAATPEPVAQALCGLMAVHGREHDQPRRLGLEVASIAAGVLAAQGVLAALVGCARGTTPRTVGTSVLQGGLLYLAHHLAIATCGEDLCPPGRAAGATQREERVGLTPPFATGDGQLVELETLRFDSWCAFWTQLGVEHEEMMESFSTFAFRYLTADCVLPAALASAVRRHSLSQLRAAGEQTGVAIWPLRGYAEVAPEGQPPPWTIRATPAPPQTPQRNPHDASPRAPLRGLRVVEIGTRLQGPLAGLLLQMLGAEVTKVEPPGGDVGRATPAAALRAAYLAYNRGKRIVEIDYKDPSGRDLLADLAARADVFVHNWRPGRAERLELDDGPLTARNPGLVYAHASGWGPDDPAVAGDFVVQAHAGCAGGLSPDGEPPTTSRVTLVDAMGGLTLCEGILAGLLVRERTGVGCRIDTSLLGAAGVLHDHVLDAIGRAAEAGRHNGRPLWGPLDRPLQTPAGLLALAADNRDARVRLRDACAAGYGEDDAALASRLSKQPAARSVARLRAAGVPAALVRSDLTSVADDPLLSPLLEALDGPIRVPAAPWSFT